MASIHKRETSRGVRYDVRYRDPTGRPRTKTFRRRSDADRYARTVEVEKDRGLFVDPKLARTPLAEVAGAWLASNPGKRGGSSDRDEQVVNGHIVPALGERPVGSLTPADVQALVNRWAAVRAPRTVRREYAVLRAILNYALRLDMVGRSPCRGINLPEVTPLRRHVVSAVEVARLADGLVLASSGRWCTSPLSRASVGARSLACESVISTSTHGLWPSARRWCVVGVVPSGSVSRSRRLDDARSLRRQGS